jgi:hypothetical protein
MLELAKILLQMTTSTPCFCNVQYKIWPLLFNRMFSFKWKPNTSRLENIWLQSPIVMCWEYCKSSTWSGSIVFPTGSNIFLFDSIVVIGQSPLWDLILTLAFILHIWVSIKQKYHIETEGITVFSSRSLVSQSKVLQNAHQLQLSYLQPRS